MPTQSIGIRELRENLAEVLLNATGPVQITRHGEPMGVYLPHKKKITEEQKRKLQESHEAILAMMEKAGVTEDDIIADLEELHKARKAKRSA